MNNILLFDMPGTIRSRSCVFDASKICTPANALWPPSPFNFRRTNLITARARIEIDVVYFQWLHAEGALFDEGDEGSSGEFGSAGMLTSGAEVIIASSVFRQGLPDVYRQFESDMELRECSKRLLDDF